MKIGSRCHGFAVARSQRQISSEGRRQELKRTRSNKTTNCVQMLPAVWCYVTCVAAGRQYGIQDIQLNDDRRYRRCGIGIAGFIRNVNKVFKIYGNR